MDHHEPSAFTSYHTMSVCCPAKVHIQIQDMHMRIVDIESETKRKSEIEDLMSGHTVSFRRRKARSGT